MKIILAIMLLGFVSAYWKSIVKIIIAIVSLLLVFKFGGANLIAVVITLGAWAAIFGFFALITSGPNTHPYDDFFKEWDKWNKRNHRW